MKPLTLRQALTILHVRTVALENIRRTHGDNEPQTGAQAIAGEALTMGPGSSGLCDLLAASPADPEQVPDNPLKHKPTCRRYISAACAVGVECEHGRDVCEVCDPCTCNDPAPDAAALAWVCVGCNFLRGTKDGACPNCGSEIQPIPDTSGRIGTPHERHVELRRREAGWWKGKP